MTRDQFECVLHRLTCIGMVWDGNDVHLEGGAVGVRLVEGVAEVHSRQSVERVSNADELEAVIQKAIQKTINS